MSVLRERVTLVWLGLVLATCATTWGLAKDTVAPAVATVGIVVVAGIKVLYVMLDFMELRDAPRGARIAFGIWPVAVVAIVLGFRFVV